MIRNDLTGREFDRLIVDSLSPEKRHGRTAWNCTCKCGQKVIATTNALLRGNTRSCGCRKLEMIGARRRTHGLSRNPTYINWLAMKSRCENPNNQDYRLYGGRGVTICDRWQSFGNFLADMGHRPFPRATIERKDTNGNYEPGNCVWATQKTQTRNKRANRLITIDGVTKCLGEWCELYGRDYRLVHHRIQNGWTPEAALSTPKQTKWSTRKGFRLGATTAA